MDSNALFSFIWQIAELLRGPYRPPQYERVILPLTVLRRFDYVLQPTKPQVLEAYEKYQHLPEDTLDDVLNKITGRNFHNHSKLDFEKLKADPNKIAENLNNYINGFSSKVRTIFERFKFDDEIIMLNENNLLYLVISRFVDADLHPDRLDNIGMGHLFEELIRKFNELANETAGDHFTPREVIKLMVDLLFAPDDDVLTRKTVITMFDPTCGTGGMLAEARKHLRNMNSQASLFVYGQDYNPRSYAIAASDLLLQEAKGDDNNKVAFGDSLIDDQFPDRKFDYLIANPPFGVEWKKQQQEVQKEHQELGFRGRFGAGLPRVNDGALLFLQHMVSKFQASPRDVPDSRGSRLAIVFNGSPLFTGGAGSGESEIRKWIIENDGLEAIIALPEQMFYNTGIATYIWIVTNRKHKDREGLVQLIDARERYQQMRRSLGNKRRELSDEDIASIVSEYSNIRDEYGNIIETETSKVFANHEFGYNRVTIERPLRLVYRVTSEAKDLFISQYPDLADDVRAIYESEGHTERNWTEFDEAMSNLLKKRGSKWKKAQVKAFRTTFTEHDENAERVPSGEFRHTDNPEKERVWGWFPDPKEKNKVIRFEPNTDLRDAENVKMNGTDAVIEVENHVSSQVITHIEDAWAERESIQSAYEINFNRYFYRYTPPRPLAEIDADIKGLEGEILRLLREITD